MDEPLLKVGEIKIEKDICVDEDLETEVDSNLDVDERGNLNDVEVKEFDRNDTNKKKFSSETKYSKKRKKKSDHVTEGYKEGKCKFVIEIEKTIIG